MKLKTIINNPDNLNDELHTEVDIQNVMEYTNSLEIKLIKELHDVQLIQTVIDYEKKFGRDKRAEFLFQDVYSQLGNEGLGETLKIYLKRFIQFIKSILKLIKDYLKAFFGTFARRAAYVDKLLKQIKGSNKFPEIANKTMKAVDLLHKEPPIYYGVITTIAGTDLQKTFPNKLYHMAEIIYAQILDASEDKLERIRHLFADESGGPIAIDDSLNKLKNSWVSVDALFAGVDGDLYEAIIQIIQEGFSEWVSKHEQNFTVAELYGNYDELISVGESTSKVMHDWAMAKIYSSTEKTISTILKMTQATIKKAEERQDGNALAGDIYKFGLNLINHYKKGFQAIISLMNYASLKNVQALEMLK